MKNKTKSEVITIFNLKSENIKKKKKKYLHILFLMYFSQHKIYKLKKDDQCGDVYTK